MGSAPGTRRNAAITTATMWEATTARPKPPKAALGEPNGVIAAWQ